MYMYTLLFFIIYIHTVNTRLSPVICFQRIWWINGFGRLTGYSLVLVQYIGTGKLWQIKNLADEAVAD